MSFWTELKRRNVFKVVTAYAIVAWLVAQVASIVLPTFDAPEWTMRVLLFVLACGLPVAAVLAWGFELTADGIRTQSDADRSPDRARRSSGRMNTLLITGLVLALVVVVLDAYVIDEQPEQESGTSPIADSVAVLPFRNLSADRDQDYFADGVSLELQGGLQNARDLYVMPRELVLPFKDTTEPLDSIAAVLGVEYLLTGSIRRAGETVLIAASLRSGANGTEVWEETYQGPLAEIFEFQAAIAAAVIAVVSGSAESPDVDLFAGGTDNEAAYDLYLRASSQVVPFFAPLGEGRDALLRQALALDPDFAQAQIALAQFLFARAGFSYGLPEWQEVADALELAVQRAVEIAPELPGTILLVAQRNVALGQWAEAERAYLDALEKSGGRTYAVNSGYGNFLLRAGRLNDAITYLERARRLAPPLAGSIGLLAIAHDALGNDGRAAELFASMAGLVGADEAFNRAPELWRRLHRGDVEGAQALADQVFGEAGSSIFGQLDDADATIRAIYAETEGPNAANANLQSFIAMLAANYGETELAMSAWRRAVQGSIGYSIFSWTPLMTPVRTHPEFKVLMRSLGLVDYWREVAWPDQCAPVGEDDFACI